MSGVDGTSAVEKVNLLKISEVARILRVSEPTAYRMRQAGAFPSVRVGTRSWRVPEPALLSLINPQEAQ